MYPESPTLILFSNEAPPLTVKLPPDVKFVVFIVQLILKPPLYKTTVAVDEFTDGVVEYKNN